MLNAKKHASIFFSGLRCHLIPTAASSLCNTRLSLLHLQHLKYRCSTVWSALPHHQHSSLSSFIFWLCHLTISSFSDSNSFLSVRELHFPTLTWLSAAVSLAVASALSFPSISEWFGTHRKVTVWRASALDLLTYPTRRVFPARFVSPKKWSLVSPLLAMLQTPSLQPLAHPIFPTALPQKSFYCFWEWFSSTLPNPPSFAMRLLLPLQRRLSVQSIKPGHLPVVNDYFHRTLGFRMKYDGFNPFRQGQSKT